MSKYINADLLNAKIYEEYDPSDNDDIHIGIGIVQDLLNEMPSADVVEVVRCKDCKYCTEQGDWCQNEKVQSMCFTDGEVEFYFGDKRGHLYPDMDFFCKYGERRESE